MNRSIEVLGLEVNATYSRDGQVFREGAVMLGPENSAGWRTKDGPVAVLARREARRRVAEKLGVPVAAIRAVSRYVGLEVDEAGHARMRPLRGAPELLRPVEAELWAWAELEYDRRAAAARELTTDNRQPTTENR